MRNSAARRISSCLIVGALTALGASAAPAGGFREHNPPAEDRYPPFRGELPPCNDPSVLSDIVTGFDSREAEFWGSGLALAEFEGVSEFGFRTNGLSYIPRRYCRAEAMFNDGKRRHVVFNIGEALGFLGRPGVTWCVEGLDRNHAFSPNCRAAGP
jgi:hypothetical protein